MKKVTIKTSKKKQVLDITDIIQQELETFVSDNGLCQLNALHTTVGLTTADLDPGTDLDMLDAYEAMIPKLDYRHPHDPSHVGDHIMSTILGTSLMIPFEKNELILGTWQRIVLVELNGPKERSIVMNVISALD